MTISSRQSGESIISAIRLLTTQAGTPLMTDARTFTAIEEAMPRIRPQDPEHQARRKIDAMLAEVQHEIDRVLRRSRRHPVVPLLVHLLV
jgi:hypothetical protein